MSDFGASNDGAADDEDNYLQFLIEEGVVLLAKYRKIHDARKRQLVVELIEALSDEERGHTKAPSTS